MFWKRKVNSVLNRTLHLRLINVESDKRRKQEARAKTRAKIGELEKELERHRKAQVKSKNRLPADYDAEFLQIWPLVQHRTMTSHAKGFALYSATNYVTRHGIPGAIVECGVWRGGSMLTVARTLEYRDSLHRQLYLFDTYTGMSEPTERDYNFAQKKSAANLLTEQPETAHVWAKASLEDVQEGFSEISYPAERIHFIKGNVEDTIPAQAPEHIAILRLDTDWYESTKHELEHLYNRLVPGGVLIIDDYGTWQGAREATDEFLEKIDDPLLLLRATHGRVAVKPWR